MQWSIIYGLQACWLLKEISAAISPQNKEREPLGSLFSTCAPRSKIMLPSDSPAENPSEKPDAGLSSRGRPENPVWSRCVT
jgi:hypothetical protein